jgi:hypothetical protein
VVVVVVVVVVVGRGELTDVAWARIESLLPVATGRGGRWRDHPSGDQRALPDHNEAELVQPREGRQIRNIEEKFRHVEVFQMGSVRTSIIEGPRPVPDLLSPPALHPQLR